MNETSLDRVIERVAKENGYALLKDDLQMVLVTVMNQIIEDQRAGVVAALESYREVHSDIALRWQLDAGKAANKILNAALDAGRAEMAKAMSAGAAQIIRIVNEAANAALAKQRVAWEKRAGEMKRFAYLMVGTAGALLAGGAALVWIVK